MEKNVRTACTVFIIGHQWILFIFLPAPSFIVAISQSLTELPTGIINQKRFFTSFLQAGQIFLINNRTSRIRRTMAIFSGIIIMYNKSRQMFPSDKVLAD